MEVCRLILDVNGFVLRMDQEDVIGMAEMIARGEMTLESFTQWVERHSRPPDQV